MLIPPPMLKLVFNCVPHALLFIEVLLVETPALALMVGNLPALAIWMVRSFCANWFWKVLNSGRFSNAAAYTPFSAGMASSAIASVVFGILISKASSLVIWSNSFSCRL